MIHGDFVAPGGEQPTREASRMRAEAKARIVKNGDVLHFLFNA